MSAKMALRRFALEAAGGFRGRDGGDTFARGLLGCFERGDDDARPEGGAPSFAHAFPIVADGKKTNKTVSCFWPERRVLVEVVDRDLMLDLAWGELLRACLQMDAEPQYVVLTNQRDVRRYDLAKDRAAPRLTIALDELPKYSEAFPFFERDWVPGTTPKIINVDKDDGTSLGLIFGSPGFQVDGEVLVVAARDGAARPTGSGTDILTNKVFDSPTWVIWLADCRDEREASSKSAAGFDYLKSTVLPGIREKAGDTRRPKHYMRWLERWWQPLDGRQKFRRSSAHMTRLIACSSPQSRPIFVFLSTKFVPTNTLQLFAYDDDYSFGIIQSSLHWEWTKAKGGRLESDIRYTSAVWKTFPWPQEPTLDDVVAVAQAARALRATRDRLMDENGWSLRDLYRAAEVEGPHPLKDAQAALDAAVEAAYGKPADQEATEFLLEMNLALAEDEAAGETIQGPGLPKVDGHDLDPKDARWFSTDCIEPPPLPKLESADG